LLEARHVSKDMVYKHGSAKMVCLIPCVESIMRAKSLGLVLALTIGLTACVARPKTAPGPADPDAAQPSLPAESTPVPVTPGSAEKVDAPVGPPPKTGLAARLARALGGDSNTANVGPCPAVRVLYDAQRFVELDGPERFENVGFTGEIGRVSSSCRYVGSDPITISLQMDMAFGKGPKAAGPSKDVVYFVTVTRKDLAIISRERFTQRVVIPAGADRIAMQSPVTQVVIPRANKDIAGNNFEVLVGFELTDAQLEFNRDGKRFRIDSGVPR
jgi:hypothetical protein